MDVIVWRLLKSADIADITGALAPRPVVLAGLVNGRNILTDATDLDRVLEPAKRAYESAGAANRLTLSAESENMAAWLIAATK